MAGRCILPAIVRLFVLCKVQAGADAGLDVGIGKLAGEQVDGPPAGAVARNDEGRVDGDQFGDGAPDDWLEEATGEMQATDEGVDGVDAGQVLGVAQDVDDASVAAT